MGKSVSNPITSPASGDEEKKITALIAVIMFPIQ
jgi:hypothetical protein